MSNFTKQSLNELWMYEFSCQDHNLINEVLNKVKKSEYVYNSGGNLTTKLDDFYHEKLFEWFYSCIEDAKTDLGFPKSINLPITICWSNKTTKVQSHHLHSHSNSFMSGIFYLSDNHTGGNTVFVCKNSWFEHYQWMKFLNKKELVEHSFTPKLGTLILFPSHISHKVTVLKDSSTRYSIAFNTFFSGIIDSRELSKTKLSIVSSSVKSEE